MKKFNLSEIMKAAHNLYKSGKHTWAGALKKSWKMAKFRITSKIEVLKARTEMKAHKDAMEKCMQEINAVYANIPPAKRSSYDDLSIPDSAYYNPSSTGRLGSHYVGD